MINSCLWLITYFYDRLNIEIGEIFGVSEEEV